MTHVSDDYSLRWFVCHTKPRCEKKFAELMTRQRLEYYLPLYESTKKYRNDRSKRMHVKTFKKALFPGYVFCRMPFERKHEAYHEDYVVRLIVVEDEKRFLEQLHAVRRLVEAGVELELCPPLEKGVNVRITEGPLMGVHAVVDDPENPRGVVVAMDILQQGVRTRVPQEYLEVIDNEEA